MGTLSAWPDAPVLQGQGTKVYLTGDAFDWDPGRGTHRVEAWGRLLTNSGHLTLELHNFRLIGHAARQPSPAPLPLPGLAVHLTLRIQVGLQVLGITEDRQLWTLHWNNPEAGVQRVSGVFHQLQDCLVLVIHPGRPGELKEN